MPKDLPSAPLTKKQQGDVLDEAPASRGRQATRENTPDEVITMSFRGRASLRRRLRQLSVNTDESMQDLFEQAIEEFLTKHKH